MKNKKILSNKNAKIESAFGTCITKKTKDSSFLENKQSPPRSNNMMKKNVHKKSDPNEKIDAVPVKTPAFSDKNIHYEKN